MSINKQLMELLKLAKVKHEYIDEIESDASFKESFFRNPSLTASELCGNDPYFYQACGFTTWINKIRNKTESNSMSYTSTTTGINNITINTINSTI